MRAQVVLLQENRILMARHERAGAIFWVLPGGAIEPHETAEEAAVREVLEETGLDIRLLRLLFVDGPREGPGVKITSPRHTYLGQIVGGMLTSIREGENAGDRGCLDGAEWMPFEADEYDAGTRDTLLLVRRALLESGASVEAGNVVQAPETLREERRDVPLALNNSLHDER